MHGSPEMELLMESRESLSPGTACGPKHKCLEVASEVRAGTGGSREGSLEEVFQQLDLAGRAASGVGEWEARKAEKHFAQMSSLGLGAFGHPHS